MRPASPCGPLAYLPLGSDGLSGSSGACCPATKSRSVLSARITTSAFFCSRQPAGSKQQAWASRVGMRQQVLTRAFLQPTSKRASPSSATDLVEYEAVDQWHDAVAGREELMVLRHDVQA